METEERNAGEGGGWGVLEDNEAQVSLQWTTISGRGDPQASLGRGLPDSLETGDTQPTSLRT